MPKKKKRPRLPNGYGSIKYMGAGRRNPYAVYPPAQDYYEESGAMITPKAIAYVDTWQKGFVILTAWHAGTFDQGMEVLLQTPEEDYTGMNDLVRRVLSDFNKMKGKDQGDKPTFEGAF